MAQEFEESGQERDHVPECGCARLPRFFEVDRHGKDLRKFPQVAVKAEAWTMLVCCPDCGQHWQVDEQDKYHVALAIRIDAPETWAQQDDVECRLEAVIERHGGLSDADCQWQGCPHEALSDMAFCPRCAYRHTGLRD